MKLLGLVSLTLPSVFASTGGPCPLISLKQVPDGSATKCIEVHPDTNSILRVTDCDSGNDGHTWTRESDGTIRSSDGTMCWKANPKNAWENIKLKPCPTRPGKLNELFKWSDPWDLNGYAEGRIAAGSMGTPDRFIYVWNTSDDPDSKNNVLFAAAPRTIVNRQYDQGCGDRLLISYTNDGGPTKKCLKPGTKNARTLINVVDCDPSDTAQNWTYDLHSGTVSHDESGLCMYFKPSKKDWLDVNAVRNAITLKNCFKAYHPKQGRHYGFSMYEMEGNYFDGVTYHRDTGMWMVMNYLKTEATNGFWHLAASAYAADELIFEDLLD